MRERLQARLSLRTGRMNPTRIYFWACFNSGSRSRSSPERGKTRNDQRNPHSGELRLRHPNLPDFEPGLFLSFEHHEDESRSRRGCEFRRPAIGIWAMSQANFQFVPFDFVDCDNRVLLFGRGDV
jgi:hypothetical protein